MNSLFKFLAHISYKSKTGFTLQLHQLEITERRHGCTMLRSGWLWWVNNGPFDIFIHLKKRKESLCT